MRDLPVTASNHGANCRSLVESTGRRSWGVIVVWGRAFCLNPEEENGWRKLGARRHRFASGIGHRWRALRCAGDAILSRGSYFYGVCPLAEL